MDAQSTVSGTSDLSHTSLAGQVAVVTGAGQGIGRAIAVTFARLGASVVVAEITAAGQEAERTIREAGGQALFVQTDVSSQASVAELARRVQEAFGTVGILINNAIISPVASVAEMDVALWDRVMAVNLRGTFLTCQAFLPGMLVRKRGVIVNMTSTGAVPFLSAYLASKRGIAGFSESLAAEVGPHGVRVIAFTPGLVDTPGLQGAGADLAPRLGMSREEFLGAAMPAERAALAAAYLVAVLADEYHGEQVDGYTVLERADVSAALGGGTQTPSTAVEGAAVAPVTTPQDAAALGERLQGVIAATVAEFERFPVFVRPLAQRGIRSKSGLRAQDWPRAAGELAGQLQGMAAEDAAAGVAFRAGYPHLRPRLEGLARYYHEAVAETARFTRDPAFMAEVTRRVGEREAVVRALLEALDAL